jgi:hypothetical protein
MELIKALPVSEQTNLTCPPITAPNKTVMMQFRTGGYVKREGSSHYMVS